MPGCLTDQSISKASIETGSTAIKPVKRSRLNFQNKNQNTPIHTGQAINNALRGMSINPMRTVYVVPTRNESTKIPKPLKIWARTTSFNGLLQRKSSYYETKITSPSMTMKV
jgi:hypothetical protein